VSSTPSRARVRTISAKVAGGTASRVSGGKNANGALYSAFTSAEGGDSSQTDQSVGGGGRGNIGIDISDLISPIVGVKAGRGPNGSQFTDGMIRRIVGKAFDTLLREREGTVSIAIFRGTVDPILTMVGRDLPVEGSARAAETWVIWVALLVQLAKGQ